MANLVRSSSLGAGDPRWIRDHHPVCFERKRAALESNATLSMRSNVLLGAAISQ